MIITYNITIEDTQTINDIEYTKEQLVQGLAQVRSQYNEQNNSVLTDEEWLQWSYLQNLSAWYENNKGADIIQPTPIIPTANWNLLLENILAGPLYKIYERLTLASFINPNTTTLLDIGNANNIAVAAGKIDQAIQVTKKEEAVAAALNLLIQTSNYRFTQDEITLWNNTVKSINFNPIMYLPIYITN